MIGSSTALIPSMSQLRRETSTLYFLDSAGRREAAALRQSLVSLLLIVRVDVRDELPHRLHQRCLFVILLIPAVILLVAPLTIPTRRQRKRLSSAITAVLTCQHV